MTEGLVEAADGRWRCWWSGTDRLYRDYHDTEWGVPVRAGEAGLTAAQADTRLFEKLCLEGFQSGLSWLTILRKREAFRRGFAGFHIPTLAGYSEADVRRLLADPGIVRHRGKIEAAIGNARAALALVDAHGSLGAFLWEFAPRAAAPPPRTPADVPAATPESTALAKALRRAGFRFVGPTTVYAFMQAMGLIDDHLVGCWRRGG